MLIFIVNFSDMLNNVYFNCQFSPLSSPPNILQKVQVHNNTSRKLNCFGFVYYCQMKTCDSACCFSDDVEPHDIIIFCFIIIRD